ncbi:MAG: hypothetical protein IJW26_05765 [Clostridia bacterium]|nr:hypothetical protein [Clostridia bacterium]
MNKIREKIKNEFNKETPDVKARVLNSVEKETQLPQVQNEVVEKPFYAIFKRMAFALSLCAVFVLGIFSGYIIPKNSDVLPSAENYVYIDVNPSVELSLTADNHVVSCTAGNEDAQKILSGLNLNNVELNTALSAIVGSMYVNGYLTTEENSMLISVDGINDDKTSALLTFITNKINAVFENSQISCSIIAQSVKGENDLVEKAKLNGVSIGKMQLIDKLINSFDELDENSVTNLSKMSIKELNLIYKHKPEKEDNHGPSDVVSGGLEGFLDNNGAITAVINHLQISSTDVQSYVVRFRPMEHSGSSAIFEVTITLIGGQTNVYNVDSKTGEVTVKEDNNIPNEPPHQGGQK